MGNQIHTKPTTTYNTHMDFTLTYDTDCPIQGALNHMHEMNHESQMRDLQRQNDQLRARQQNAAPVRRVVATEPPSCSLGAFLGRGGGDRAVERERDATVRVQSKEARKTSTAEARKCLFGSKDDWHVELKTQWDTSTKCAVKPDEPVASYIRCVFGLPSNRGVSLCFAEDSKMSLSRIAENKVMFKDLGLDHHATITVLGTPNPFAPVEPLVGFDPFSSAQQTATEGEQKPQNPQDGACTVGPDLGLDQHAHAGTPDPFPPVAPWVNFEPFDAQVQSEVRDPLAPVTARNWVSFDDPFTTQPDNNMAVNKSQGGSKNDAMMDPFSPFSPAMTTVDFVPFTSPTSVA